LDEIAARKSDGKDNVHDTKTKLRVLGLSKPGKVEEISEDKITKRTEQFIL